jgi:hypothetical protein
VCVLLLAKVCERSNLHGAELADRTGIMLPYCVRQRDKVLLSHIEPLFVAHIPGWRCRGTGYRFRVVLRFIGVIVPPFCNRLNLRACFKVRLSVYVFPSEYRYLARAIAILIFVSDNGA